MNERRAGQRFGWTASGVLSLVLLLGLFLPLRAEYTADFRSIAADVSIADDAYIEWNFPLNEPNAGELAKIKHIFEGAIRDAAKMMNMTGQRDLVLRAEVVRLDILSRVEIFFCCAQNEVSAIYELVDAVTSEVVKPAEIVNFDHFGRGGVIALMSAAGGEDQLTHLQNTIRDGTVDWLLE